MKNKGITLVALVITIIILLILAGITIAQLTNSGLFENAKLAKEKYENAQVKENEILSSYFNENKTIDTSTRDDEIENLKARIKQLEDNQENYALKNDLSGYATKTEVSNLGTANMKAGAATMPACSGNNGTYVDVQFTTAFPNTDYAIAISSEVAGNSWSYAAYEIQSKTVNGFRINMWQNNSVALASHKVYWVATPYNK